MGGPKATWCANSTDVNFAKMKITPMRTSIQFSRSTVKENGDVYITLPENHEKLESLLKKKRSSTGVVVLKRKQFVLATLSN